MKKHAPYIVLLVFTIAITLNACTRPQSTQPIAPSISPTSDASTLLLDAIASQTAAPTVADITPTDAQPATPTEAPPPTNEPTVVPSSPTETPLTALTLMPKDQPIALPSPTVTPQGAPFDPVLAYGTPDFLDSMNWESHGNWVSGGVLPNTAYLQISLQDDQLYVTGKQPGFSTWFFSWPTLTDFYLQLAVDNGECSGKDEYGLILRGPAHKAGVSYGYIVAFTCDGYYRLTRLDSADPYTAVDLVPLTRSEQINTGVNQRNLIGVRAEGSKLALFANGYFLTEVNDAAYPQGRYGLFVQAVDTYNYTYRPIELAYWELQN
ncbi:MAG TPA: hypothetical protein EYP88_04885 [Anaerolineales bacterium]|nr:hypothetical protein [Anaerolineales bacterium]